MTQYLQQILVGQFEASLTMLRQCIEACPPEQWEARIANGTFRWVAYHTLFFVDLYVSASEDTFVVRELHHRGGDEREPRPAAGLEREETLAYLGICRQKVIDTLAGETQEVLEGPCGFSWRKFSRGELHIYNIRHIQHHTGQLGAHLRRVDPAFPHSGLPWIGSGWQ